MVAIVCTLPLLIFEETWEDGEEFAFPCCCVLVGLPVTDGVGVGRSVGRGVGAPGLYVGARVGLRVGDDVVNLLCVVGAGVGANDEVVVMIKAPFPPHLESPATFALTTPRGVTHDEPPPPQYLPAPPPQYPPPPPAPL